MSKKEFTQGIHNTSDGETYDEKEINIQFVIQLQNELEALKLQVSRIHEEIGNRLQLMVDLLKTTESRIEKYVDDAIIINGLKSKEVIDQKNELNSSNTL